MSEIKITYVLSSKNSGIPGDGSSATTILGGVSGWKY